MSAYLSAFDSFFDLTRGDNSAKLSCPDILGLCSNFVESESFLESNFPDIFALCETKFNGSIDSGDLSVRVSSFKPKGFYYSCTWSCSLCERRTSFCMGLTLENSADSSMKLCRLLLMFLAGFTSLTDLLPFPLLITFVFTHSF